MKIKTGTFTTNTSAPVSVNCGFKPSYFMIHHAYTTAYGDVWLYAYNSSYTTSGYYGGIGTYNGYPIYVPFSTYGDGKTNLDQVRITSTGFDFAKASKTYTLQYICIA